MRAIFVILIGLAGMCFGIALPDLLFPKTPTPSPTAEEVTCVDTKDTIGYMVRRPLDPHGIEYCMAIARNAPPRFVSPIVAPFLFNPLHPKRKKSAHI